MVEKAGYSRERERGRNMERILQLRTGDSSPHICVHTLSTTPLSVNFILLVVTIIVLIMLLLRGIFFSFSLSFSIQIKSVAFLVVSPVSGCILSILRISFRISPQLFPFYSPLSRAFSLVLFSFLIFYPRSMSILASLFITSSSQLMCSLSLSFCSSRDTVPCLHVDVHESR